MRWGGNDWGKYGKKLQKQVVFMKQPAFAGPRWETRTPDILLPNKRSVVSAIPDI